MDGQNNSFYKDYYYILGVSPDATAAEIQAAYTALNERYGPHVQVVGQDAEAMLKTYKEVTEAYETLGDPGRRQQYDQVNLPHLQKNHLRQLWGKMTGTNQNLPGSRHDAEETFMDLEVTLREAMRGATKTVRIDENLPCKACANLKPVQRMQCQQCHGVGHIHNARQESIELDPGMYDRMQVRRSALGKFDARVNKNGDLVLNIKLRPHSYFELMGRDIICTVPVTFLEAILGGEIQVPTPVGKVIMKIQPLTQSGRVYRLKGMGLAGADLLATIDVVVPKQISADEVLLFQKLQAISTTPNPREEILARLKDESATPDPAPSAP